MNLYRSFGSSRLSKVLVSVFIISFFTSPISAVLAEETVPALEASAPVVQESIGATTTTPENTTPTDTTTPLKDLPKTNDSEKTPEENPKTLATETPPPLQDVVANNPDIYNPGTTTPYNTSGSQQVLQPKTDASTGALTFEYPIKVPPGRNGQTPDLKLKYNSRDNFNNSIFGYGWTSNIPYIERINKDGVNNLYSENYFYSSLDGELTSQGSGNFTPKTENGSFSKYNLSSNQWLITDKQGTIYKFGYNSATRQDDPNNPAHIFKWMLEEIKDTNGNFITYTYYKDAGQIYPSSITYSNNGSNTGIFEIDFLRTSRSDAMASGATGFSSTTTYLINEIDIKVNGTWTSKYVLSYTSGANGNRSLLSSIVQSGQDSNNVVTTLPATTFSYTQSTPGFTYADKGTSYIPIDTHNGTLPVDVNGDGYSDLVQAYSTNGYYDNSYPDVKNIYLYHPESDNFQLDTTRSVPNDIFIAHNHNYYAYDWYDAGTKGIDANGDGLNDLLRWDNYGGGGAYEGNINNGSGWDVNSNWFLHRQPYAVTDLNGDGLQDYISTNHDGQWFTSIDWNTGSNFSFYQTYLPGNPFKLPVDNLLNEPGVFVDINGDGLSDFIISTSIYNSSPTQAVYLNTGTGWVLDTSYLLPRDFVIYGVGYYGNSFSRNFFQDINGDGLVDILVPGALNYVNKNKVYINKGHYWDYDSNWDSQADLGAFSGQSLTPALIFDANGDGLVDIINTNPGSGSSINSSAYFNNTQTPVDLLNSITLPTGGQTTVSYKMSGEYKDGSGNLLNPNLPFNIPTVHQITVNDGNGNSGTTTHNYQGGTYFFNTSIDRKFAGFSKVIETNPAGNKTTTYYHQGNTSDSANGEYNDDEWKINKPYRVETADNSGNLYSVVVNKWDDYDLGNGSKFVKLIRTTNLTYDGTSSHRDTAQEYTHDNTYGNVISKTDWGEVVAGTDGSFTDTGSDKSIENILYVANTDNYVVGLPYNNTTFDQSSIKVNETKTYYDGNSLGVVGLGNPTKVEKWITGNTYVNSQKSYDGTYGLVVTSTDPNGKVTNYAYDTYNLYPATITNPLSQTVQYLYDYSLGEPRQTTDQNGNIYQTNYDGLNRMIEEKIPDPTGGATPVTKTIYVYTDTSNAVSVHKVDYLDASNTVDTYQYFDGLGRLIQERKEAEIAGNFNVSDTAYNALGLIQKQSLKYTSSGTEKTVPTTDTTLYTNNTYDALNRILTSTNSVGTTSYTYTLWKTNVIDANGKQKNYYKDTYGNLVKVEEINAGATYSTNYTYNLNGNLLNITDALNNLRNFTYDGLGRRLTAEDLHVGSDTTFGIYTYTYDAAGNLTQVINPKNQTINYTYDALNRQLTEDFTENTGTEVTYTYDAGTDGIGHLTGIVTEALTQNNTYTPVGRLKSEAKTLDGTTYTTSYDYDRQGNQISITYPDNSQVKYIYNTAGLLNQVQRKESTDPNLTDVVTNFDYSPTEQPTTISYANGAITTNTYDATKLYRLAIKVTTAGSGNIQVQNLSYSYDPVGNITQIVDTSQTSTNKTANYVYDDLNRLTSATITNVATGQTPYTENYTYDAIGNITSGGAGNYTYAGTDYANPHAVTSIGSKEYTYDNNGNLLTETDGLTNTWDYNNRLTQTVKDGKTSTYLYDPGGQRIKVVNENITTYYPNKYYNIDSNGKVTKEIYANGVLVADITVPSTLPFGTTPSCTPPTSGNWTITTSCTFTGIAIAPASVIVNAGKVLTLSPNSKLLIDLKTNKLLVKHTGGLLIKHGATLRQVKTSDTNTTPVISYILTDHLNSTNIVTDNTGNIVETLDYYPYGNIRIDNGSTKESRKYVGQFYDQNTNLNYLNARYENGTQGRFISEDPVFWELGITKDGKNALIYPQTQNSYSYANGNPIVKSDPNGRCPICIAAGVGFLFSAATEGISQTIQEAYYMANVPSNQMQYVDRGNTNMGPINIAPAISSLKQGSLSAALTVATFGLASNITTPGINLLSKTFLNSSLSFSTVNTMSSLVSSASVVSFSEYTIYGQGVKSSILSGIQSSVTSLITGNIMSPSVGSYPSLTSVNSWQNSQHVSNEIKSTFIGSAINSILTGVTNIIRGAINKLR
jgi:RHS repeat-associated protein